METSRLQSWIASSRSEYCDDLIRAGERAEQARASVEQTFARYFPDGSPAEGHYVYDVVADGKPVGYLWIGPHVAGDTSAWWVWDIAIDADQQGHGFGRESMLLAEDRVREYGGSTLGLNVFGFNAAARGLYESLDYETTSVRMLKRLS
jgi:ribosomal protein S18 acetylase RimI-like enzyme